MEKIGIFNANNESMQVEVVRYFSDSNNKYFIFSLHELDAEGHMNIYVTKIMDQNGTLVGTNIIDDVEWTNLKSNLQRIIKENRTSGNAIVNDLPYSVLRNIKVVDRRALKLLATSVDMLNLGYKPEEPATEGISEPIADSFEQPNVQNPVQNATIPQNDGQNGLGIFDNNTQVTPNSVQNPVNNANTNQQPAEQHVQKPVDNSVADNYKDLYFQEKENTAKLTEENNRLMNELNNCKSIISDIKNILSRQ